jgi:hypothetical protein
MLLQTVGAVAVLAIAGVAQAEVMHFKTTLNGASEVPPNTSAGKGSATADLDTATKVLTYKVDYSGLTGPATMAHFHGPAAAGVNAGVMTPIKVGPSPIAGKATLTDAQIAELKAGKVYVNVHTAAHPGGEIRGQLMSAK